MMFASISFEIDAADKSIAIDCVERWSAMFYAMKRRTFAAQERRELLMDLVACHANGNPLDFARLLAAPNKPFMHDVGGIRINLDRQTGKLLNFFTPLHSAPRSAELIEDIRRRNRILLGER